MEERSVHKRKKRTHNKEQPSYRTLQAKLTVHKPNKNCKPFFLNWHRATPATNISTANSQLLESQMMKPPPHSLLTLKKARSKLTEKNTSSTKEHNAPYKDTDRQTDTQRRTTDSSLAKHLTEHSTSSYTAPKTSRYQYSRVVVRR